MPFKSKTSAEGAAANHDFEPKLRLATACARFVQPMVDYILANHHPSLALATLRDTLLATLLNRELDVATAGVSPANK